MLQDRENCVLDFEVPRPGLKKFSLRPPTLVLRPVSPDSPSVDKEGEGDVFSSSFSSYGAGVGYFFCYMIYYGFLSIKI